MESLTNRWEKELRQALANDQIPRLPVIAHTKKGEKTNHQHVVSFFLSWSLAMFCFMVWSFCTGDIASGITTGIGGGIFAIIGWSGYWKGGMDTASGKNYYKQRKAYKQYRRAVRNAPSEIDFNPLDATHRNIALAFWKRKVQGELGATALQARIEHDELVVHNQDLAERIIPELQVVVELDESDSLNQQNLAVAKDQLVKYDDSLREVSVLIEDITKAKAALLQKIADLEKKIGIIDRLAAIGEHVQYARDSQETIRLLHLEFQDLARSLNVAVTNLGEGVSDARAESSARVEVEADLPLHLNA